MPYCTQQNLIDRFGADELIQLTDSGGVGMIDSATVSAAINDASAEIDSYLRNRYPFPLLSTPPELERIACNIARYYLYNDSAINAVSERFEQAIEWLKLLAQGKVMIDSQYLTTIPHSNPLTSCSVATTTRVYSDAALVKMIG
jgi:phage gp36-like protein